jgi:hypothetical protein
MRSISAEYDGHAYEALGAARYSRPFAKTLATACKSSPGNGATPLDKAAVLLRAPFEENGIPSACLSGGTAQNPPNTKEAPSAKTDSVLFVKQRKSHKTVRHIKPQLK